MRTPELDGPLRPEAKLRHELPAPQRAWPAADRPWMSADVRRWPWRLSLTSSLSRCACAGGWWPDGSRDGSGWRTRLTVVREPRASMRARSYHASPGDAKASVLWIVLWMLSANRLVNRCEAVDERGCGKVDNGEDARLAQVRKPLLSTSARRFPQFSLRIVKTCG